MILRRDRMKKGSRDGKQHNQVTRESHMNIINILAKSLLIITLTSTVVLPVAATQPTTVPPRGHAYGYYMKDGGYVLFTYLEDGTRLLQLSNCWKGVLYRIDATADLKSWVTLSTVEIQKDGTASYIDTMPADHRYYKVIRAK